MREPSVQPHANEEQSVRSTHDDVPLDPDEDEDDVEDALLVELLLLDDAPSPPPYCPVHGPWLNVAQALSQWAFGP